MAAVGFGRRCGVRIIGVGVSIMVRSFVIGTLMVLSATTSFAQDAPETGKPPAKIRSVTLTPGEQCPPSTDGEIVVCNTLEEPYRIPKALRQSVPTAANQPWANRVEGLDEAGREGGGLPNTCSPSGTGGQSGCTQQLLDRWRAERRAPK